MTRLLCKLFGHNPIMKAEKPDDSHYVACKRCGRFFYQVHPTMYVVVEKREETTL